MKFILKKGKSIQINFFPKERVLFGFLRQMKQVIIVDNGKKEFFMDMESMCGKILNTMKDFTKMVRKKVLENMFIQMGLIFRDTGRMENKMGLVSYTLN